MADAFQVTVKEYKAAFFNRHAIEAKVDAYKDSELARLGAYTRQRMKSSLKYRKKSSAPGQPPTVHRKGFKRKTVNRKTGAETVRETSPLKELIFFAKTPQGSVVVGPAKFGNRPGVVPPTLEKGGPAVIVEPVPRAKGRKATPRQSLTFRQGIALGTIVIPPREKKYKTIRIAPRPFVRPAGEAEARAGKFRKA